MGCNLAHFFFLTNWTGSSHISRTFFFVAPSTQVLLPSACVIYVSAGIKFSICKPYIFWNLYSFFSCYFMVWFVQLAEHFLNFWCDLSRLSHSLISLSSPLSITYFRFSLLQAYLFLHLHYLVKCLTQVLSKLWLNWGLHLFKINYLRHENDEFVWYSHPIVACATSYMRKENGRR